MPWMLMLVSLLVSVGVFVQADRMLAVLAEQQAVFRSEAVLNATESQGVGELVLNRDVVVEDVTREQRSDRLAFQEQFYERSGEVRLMDLEGGEALESVVVEYCQAGEVCPEVVVEWFRVEPGYRFQRLADLEESDFEVEPRSPCLEIPRTEVQRCVVVSEGVDFGPVQFTERGFRFQTDFPAYAYVLRFWSDEEGFVYRVFGERGGEKVPLPGRIQEEDVTSESGAVARRIRRQRLLSAGLQDGLNYAHYSFELENK